MIDVPNIIDWNEWKKSDENNSEFYLKEYLSLLKQKGILIDMDINLVTHIISAALNELSIYILQKLHLLIKRFYTTISKLLKSFKIEYN